MDAQTFVQKKSSDIAGSQFSCPYCGKTHAVPFKTIRIGSDLLQELPALGLKGKRIAVIYDREIEELVTSLALEPLTQAGLTFTTFPVGAKGYHLDSEINFATDLAKEIGPSYDWLISVGSGVISDTMKYVATQLDKPFVTIGTAPSMNGYMSMTATITENKVKISHLLRPADIILLDTKLMATAPIEMLHAGYGDLCARCVCNVDWLLAHRLKNGSFCPVPYQLTENSQNALFTHAAGIAQRTPEAIEAFDEAISISGLSMTILNGETSPSSGAEHVLSHFWDLMVHTHGAHKNFHGTQVGVATLIILALYENLFEFDMNSLDPEKLLKTRKSLAEIELENEKLFGSVAPSFNAVARQKFIADADLPAYIQNIQTAWPTLSVELKQYLTPLATVKEAYRQVGFPATLSTIHRSQDQAMLALLHGNHYRPRYTILDLAWEIGIFPEAGLAALQRAGVL